MKYRAKVRTKSQSENTGFTDGLHFIIGYAVEQNFYVNPAIFNAIDRMHEMGTFGEKCSYKRRIQLHGLEINQENFEEFCQRTNFKKYFTFDGYDYAMHRM